LFVVAALVAAACGGSRKTTAVTTTGGTGSTTPGSTKVVDTSACPAGSDTVGVTGNTISIGTSLPESGLYQAFTAIRDGEKSYFQYLNALGGVEVAGKKYQIKLVAKGDAYDAGKTVTNVQSLINDSKVFALFNVVGTKNNLAIRNYVNTNCVPDLLIASGAVQWGNQKYPWMLGSELVPYPLEMRAFVDYLKQKKPNATIALLRASDDFGQSYEESLKSLIKGTKLKLVQTQSYDAEGADVKSQVTSLAATHADAFVIGAALLACPAALNAKGDAGWHPITYLSGTCVSKLLLLVGGGVYGDTSALRPTQRFWNLKQLASTPERVSHVPITCDGAVHCAALMNAREGSLAVHVVNNGASRPAVLTGIPVGITTLRVWRTDTQRAMQEGTPIQVRNGRASVVLDATSYMTLIAKR